MPRDAANGGPVAVAEPHEEPGTPSGSSPAVARPPDGDLRRGRRRREPDGTPAAIDLDAAADGSGDGARPRVTVRPPVIPGRAPASPAPAAAPVQSPVGTPPPATLVAPPPPVAQPPAAIPIGDPLAHAARAMVAWRETLATSGPPGVLLVDGDPSAATGPALDVTHAHPSGLAQLMVGGPVRLSSLVREGEAQDEARRRARLVRVTGDRLAMDVGVRSTALAVGSVTWWPPRRPGAQAPAGPVRAPLLLRPCALRPLGAGTLGVLDHDLVVEDLALVNPELVRALRADHGLRLDPEALGALAFGPRGFDPQPVYEWLRELCAQVPGFTVEHRLVVGTFTAGSVARLADLEWAAPALESHPVFGVPPVEEPARPSSPVVGPPADPEVDGDGDAGVDGAPRVAPPRPYAGPERERDPGDLPAVLDLDPAQRRAVEAIVSGRNVAVEGPPGSGLTQTLAAAVGGLLAQGRRALLVTPHRATADAMLARLDEAGLGEAVLDLHDGSGDRARLLATLADAVEATLSGRRQERAAEELERTRTAPGRVRAARAELSDATRALHAVRVPWEVSAYDAMAALAQLMAAPRPPSTRVRLGHDVTRRLDRATRERLRADLHEAATLGLFSLTRVDTRWLDAFLPSQELAGAALAVARAGRDHLGQARWAMQDVATSAGLAPATTAGGWRPQLQLLLGVRDTLDVLLPAVFEQPLDELVAATSSDGGPAGLSRMARRAVRKRAQALVRPGVHVPDLHAVLTVAQVQRRRWAALTSPAADGEARDGDAPGGAGPVWPRVPTGLAAAEAAVGAVEAALEVLGAALAPTGLKDLRTLPLDDLARLLADLAEDEQGARDQPRRGELLDRLRAAGLGELLDDLQSRRAGPQDVDGELDLAWWTSVLEAVVAGDGRLAGHDPAAVRVLPEELRSAERALLVHARALALDGAARAAREAVERHPDQTRWLRAEVYRGHRSQWPADLFRRAPDVVGALCPVWVMSPDAVARLLPPGTSRDQLVDVVIVDDAGQVGVADAVAAVVRGRSVAVAGDRLRLPPASGDPSVLEAVAARTGVMRLDRDHRARDGRLLAPLQVAYPQGWATVPGAGPQVPLEFSHVADGVAVPPPGQDLAQSPDAEVRRVVELVAEHAARRPGESLLVVTLGQRHASRIEEALRAEAAGRPDLQRWLEVHWTGHISEPFLVRPVHRIAGLERDATIVSIGLARTPHGRVLHRFGVLDGRHGRACLLAALSRARRRTTLVCCFVAGDLASWRVRSEGARLLHHALAVAADPARYTDRTPAVPSSSTDPLVADLRDRLLSVGMPVLDGVEGPDRPADLVVADPLEDGRMLLAVDVDGHGHAALAGVSLRERQRREAFERAGWSYLRVAAMDLFCDPGAEVERIREAWRAAGGGPSPQGGSAGPIVGRPRPRTPRPDVAPGRPLHAYTPEELDAVARWVLSDGIRRDGDQLSAGVREALHLVRRGGQADIVLGACAARVLARGRTPPPSP